ncbi:hypothetical protein BT69DRAFT_1296804 [Atractiella rhizophila]|nr:hypothetical protein BT69DRAFT_1296804 [Atractiella rhizophila]
MRAAWIKQLLQQNKFVTHLQGQRGAGTGDLLQPVEVRYEGKAGGIATCSSTTSLLANMGSCCIRLWAAHYEEINDLSVSNRGRHVKTFSLLHDPEVCGILHASFRMNKWSMDPTNLAKSHVNTMVPLALEKTKGNITGDCKEMVEERGFPVDQEVFIPELESYMLRLRQYEVGNVMNEVVMDLPPPGDQALVMFDNSTGHGALAKDALNTKQMNQSERCLAAQPDFQEQKLLVQEILEWKGHKAIFLPKFHSKLNFIVFFW